MNAQSLAENRPVQGSHTGAWLCLALATLTLLVFAPAVRFGYIALDDHIYVDGNRALEAGLRVKGLRWAFTANLTQMTSSAEYWEPLTLISRLADYQMFGFAPWGHHLTSMLLHLASGLALFGALHRLTGTLWRSWMVAALFLIHPMHVEPVVWLSARKDLLSGLFYIFTIWAYGSHAQRPGPWRYVLLWGAFLGANMSKPMSVSLPLVLLLLDFWPLRRIEPGNKEWCAQLARALWQKLGFVIVSVGVGLLAYLVQKHIGAVADDALLPLGWRVAAAAVAGVTYVFKAFVPIELTLFYPHPGRTLSLIGAAGSAVLLFVISLAVWRQHARRPWLTLGWFWFLVVIAPVSGIIQVGDQMMADRYSYLAFVGLFIAAVWQVAEWAAPPSPARVYLSARAVRVLGGGVLGAFAVAAWMQVQTWRSSEAAFTHAIDVTENNHVAHFNLGATLWEQDPRRRDEAVAHMREAGRIRRPFLEYQLRDDDEALARGALAEAIPRFVRVLMLTPWDTDLRQRLASTLVRHREPGKALVQFNEALRYQPQLIPPRLSIAEILIGLDQPARAERVLRDVLSIDPLNREALALLASLPSTSGDRAESRGP